MDIQSGVWVIKDNGVILLGQNGGNYMAGLPNLVGKHEGIDTDRGQMTSQSIEELLSAALTRAMSVCLLLSICNCHLTH